MLNWLIVLFRSTIYPSTFLSIYSIDFSEFDIEILTKNLNLSTYKKIVTYSGTIQWASVGFPGGSDGKAYARNAGGLGLIPGWGRSPGEDNGNPLQYSCLENPMGGGAW